MTKTPCKNCGKLKKKTSNFCRSCYLKNHTKTFSIKCAECNKEFIVNPTIYYAKGVRRCSLMCANRAKIGRKKSEEHKKKIGLAHIGIIPYLWTKEQRERRSRERMGIYPLANKTDEEKKKIYEKVAENNRKPRPEKRGENSHSWKGGISKENHRIRQSFEYKEWRKAVFVRDDYTCCFCGRRGVYLEADHIKPFAYFRELRFDVSNGRTLCKPCHLKTNTYGARILQYT